ncbi:MAG: response regulator transcription factor [Gammaproteobacteria bacterium]|nr:response regulator transcription factor [Gammaproteobacteria bacterium]
MNILIVDDEQLARQRLCDMVAEINQDFNIYEAVNGKDAIDKVSEYKPDTVILDIRMPVMDGLEAAMHIAALMSPPAIIFATAFDEHAIQAFDANAIDYLLKPVRKERLIQALDKAQQITSSGLTNLPAIAGTNQARTHLSSTSTGKTQLIPVEQISCLQADQKYITVYWNDNQTLLDEPLKNLEQEFADRFFRIHRNALIALDQIQSLEKTTEGGYVVHLKDIQKPFSVSRRHIADLRKRLKNM